MGLSLLPSAQLACPARVRAQGKPRAPKTKRQPPAPHQNAHRAVAPAPPPQRYIKSVPSFVRIPGESRGDHDAYARLLLSMYRGSGAQAGSQY